MAKKVKSFDFTPVGRPAKYPWDQWLDGGIWELKAGEDFDTEIASFRVQIQANAKRRRGYAQTSVRGNFLYIQFIKR